MADQNPSAAKPAGKKVVVTRRFDAPAGRVFDAWLDPATAGRWLFATPGGKMLRVEMDARVGGAFTVTEQRAGLPVEHLGTYLEIARPRRLAFSFCVPKYSDKVTRVTVGVARRGAGCELTLMHEDVPPEYQEGAAAGWTGIVDHLAECLSKA